jgi:aminopeptidase YwaD
MGDAVKLPQIGTQQVKDAFAFTDEVVEGYPDRLTGTEPCHRAGRRIKEEFEKFCDPGSVKSEEITTHPLSFLKYIPGLVVLYYFCVALLFFVPSLAWVAFAGMALGLFVFYGQFLRYWHLLDPLFPKAKGYNIWGSIEPSGEVRQQVIVSAHHDAAYVFQILARMPKLYTPLMAGGVLLMVVALLTSLAAGILLCCGIAFPQWIPLVLIILGIFELPFLFFTTNQVVPGAGDNMISVAIAAGIGRLFGNAKKAGNNPLKHTRLIILSFDAEECGLRGARAWIKLHLQELKKTKTYALNLDTIYKLKALNFFDADLNSMVKLSKEMAQECVDISGALGYKAYVSRMSPGGGATDAAAFGEAGIEATNLCAMSFIVSDYDQGWVYHTPKDTTKHIEPEAVEASLKVIREYILRKDAGA